MDVSPRSERAALVLPTSVALAIARLGARIPHGRRLVLALTLAGMAFAVAWILAVAPDGRDAHAYYDARLDHLYTGGPLSRDAYLYPPLLAQVIQPLQALPWPAFAALVRALNVAALGISAGPFAGPLVLTLPIQDDLGFGNINLWLGLLVVAGLRWPALWSLVLLTKITPGLGVMWFAGRRDWRGFGIAVGTTLAVAAIAFAVAPRAWIDWLGFVTAPSSDPSGVLASTWFPLRLVVAALLATWAGYRNQAWALVIASWFAVPLLEPGTYAMLTPLLWFLWRHRSMWAARSATARSTVRGVASAEG